MRFAFTDIVIYGFTIMMVEIIAGIAERVKRESERMLCFALIVLVPSILAGIRGDTVGTDILVYAEPVFRQAHNSKSLVDLYDYCVINHGSFEIGFLFLARVTSFLTNSLGIFLFLLQLLAVLPITVIAYKNARNQSIKITMEVYMLLFYGYTLNIMREGVAASWLLLAYVYYKENKCSKTVIFTLVAVLFHKTAIFGIVMYAIAEMVSKHLKKMRYMIIVLASFGVLVSLISHKLLSLINLFVEIGIFPPKYAYYFGTIFKDGDSGRYSNVIGPTSFVEPALILILILMLIPLVKKESEKGKGFCYQVVLIINLVLELGSIIILNSNNHNRLTIYYSFILILCIPYLFKYYSRSLSNNMQTSAVHGNRDITNIRCIVLEGSMYLYFFLIFIYGGWHHINFFVFR